MRYNYEPQTCTRPFTQPLPQASVRNDELVNLPVMLVHRNFFSIAQKLFTKR